MSDEPKAECSECDGFGEIPDDDGVMRECPSCAAPDPGPPTLRERIFGPGAYYEGGAAVPVPILAATWLAFRLDRCAWHLRQWGRGTPDSWGWGRRG